MCGRQWGGARGTRAGWCTGVTTEVLSPPASNQLRSILETDTILWAIIVLFRPYLWLVNFVGINIECLGIPEICWRFPEEKQPTVFVSM